MKHLCVFRHCTGHMSTNMEKNGCVKNGILKKSSPPSTFKKYFIALRPWSFSASLMPVILGCVLASKTSLSHQGQGYSFNVWNFLACCLAAVSVHAAGNLVNTYFDYVRGVDDQKNADDRTLVDHILSADDVAWFGGFFYCLGCLGFLLVTFTSSARMEHLALVYFGGLSSSFLYTGGLGLKYIALGDIVIFLTFGPLTVLFAFLAQSTNLSWLPLVYALPMALTTEAILHTNNVRDAESDKRSGVVTMAIILGHSGSYVLFNLLIFVPYIGLSVLAMHYSKWFLLPVLTIVYAFRHEKNFRQQKLRKLPQAIAKLNLLFGLTYILSIVLTPYASLPGV